MSKYKVGDKVLIEGKINKIEYGLNFLVDVDVDGNHIIIKEDKITSKTYSDGLNDAWELARKITSWTYSDRKKVLEFGYSSDAFMQHTYQEALAKIEAYEKSKQIQVGDVVYADDEPDSFGVVTWINEKLVYVMWDDGSCGCETRIEELHKTGKTVDIEHLLEQIRGNE